MKRWFRFGLSGVVALALVAGGFGTSLWAQQTNEACTVPWDDGADAGAECEDFVHAASLYGGGVVGVVGVLLLVQTAWFDLRDSE